MVRSLVMIGALGACSYTPTANGAADAQNTDGTPATDGNPPTDMSPPAFVRRINIGGAALTGSDFPGAWEADSQAASVCGPFFWDVTQGIKNTVDDALFVNHVYGLPELTCAIPNIPAGSYQVTLVFGPTFYGSGCNTTAQQRFSISLEGTLVEADYNLSAESLGCVMESGTVPTAHPVARTYTVAIDGTLDIVETAPSGEAAMLSAVQIIQP